MDFKTKRKLKKQARLCFILAYVFMGLFFLSLILVLILAHKLHKPLADYVPAFVIIMPVVLSPFGSLISMNFAQGYRQQRVSYKNNIHRYRARKFFQQILFQIQVLGDVQAGVNIYKGHDFSCEPLLDDYLYGIMITECRHSDISNYKEIATQKFNKLKNAYSPDKIVFN